MSGLSQLETVSCVFAAIVGGGGGGGGHSNVSAALCKSI